MMFMARKDITIIRVRKRTRDRLREFGKKGDTYDDVIWKLMDEAKKRERK